MTTHVNTPGPFGKSTGTLPVNVMAAAWTEPTSASAAAATSTHGTRMVWLWGGFLVFVKGARQTSGAVEAKKARVQVWSLVSGDKGLYKGLQQREGWRGATPLVSPPVQRGLTEGSHALLPLVFPGQDLKKWSCRFSLFTRENGWVATVGTRRGP